MSTLLTRRLKVLCENDSELDVLWGQWIFDEKLISKALQNINQIFPHYSRHDSSHSKQILVNIEKFLGEEKVNLLSATDIWLLLESAYLHDIGMVIPMDTIRKDWESENFRKYLNYVYENSTHDLNFIAKKYIQTDLNIDLFNYSSWPLDVFEEVRLILADYYRAKHPFLSEKIVNNPWNEISLNSPRNELLPKRLFSILGKICSHHGLPFSEVMKLPHIENGVGRDQCHPKFVACLLRLGDLLDLDNNRFCPVMLRSVSFLPNTTKAHIEKHFAIEHFRADEHRIEVEAICDTHEGYSATAQWFDYIKNEIRDQMIQWDKIVPNKSLGLLPGLGRLDIKLNKYEILDGKNRPQFVIDQEKTFEMLQGSDLYSNRFESIRELLQNAVDTTLLKFWSEHIDRKKFQELDFSAPNQQVLDELKKYPICVKMEIDRTSQIEDGFVNWSISIIDKGMGFDRDDLNSLQKIGSSSRNQRKQLLINGMPGWMRPSGAFGIGFQSVFLLSDKVTLTTKSYYSSDVLKVEFHKPGRNSNGDIFVTKISEPYKFETGSSIKFNTIYEKVPSSFTYSYDDDVIRKAIKNFDPINDQRLDINILNILNQIKVFANRCIIPIEIYFDNLKEDIIGNSKYFTHFNSEEQLQFDEIVSSNRRNNINFYYKWQPIEAPFTLPFLNLEINILSENANELLEINRNKIKKDKKDYLKNKLINGLSIEINRIKHNSDESEKPFLDAFLQLYGKSDNEINEALQLNILNSENINLKKAQECVEVCFKLKSILKYHSMPTSFQDFDSPDVSVDSENKITIKGGLNLINNEVISLLSKVIRPKSFPSINISNFSVNNESDYDSESFEFTYNKNNGFIIEEEALIYALEKNINNTKHSVCLRNFMHCTNDYISLSVEPEALWLMDFLLPINFAIPSMVFPFVFKENEISLFNFEKLIDWVFEKRTNKNITKELIKTKYNEYIHYIDNLMSRSERWTELKNY